MPSELASDLLDVLDQLSGGVHAGFRPVHARGVMYSGTFTPSDDAAKLTRAPHAVSSSTPVTVRFSVSAGIPTIADNDATGSSPQAMAVRFHLGDHVHTDIIAHSHNGFPTRTGEDVTVTERVDELAPERRKIIFDPVPRVDGIESAGDPLTEVRSDIYLLSGRRRRADAAK
jgi:catalase